MYLWGRNYYVKIYGMDKFGGFVCGGNTCTHSGLVVWSYLDGA